MEYVTLGKPDELETPQMIRESVAFFEAFVAAG
jgi:hypothetical protein